MKHTLNVLGIIPARSGSKSIPHKNIKLLLGKPLIAWSIESALKSKLSRVIVSTDDAKIAAIAKKYGAEVPFLRPKELARDTTPTLPVVVHALDWLKKHESYIPDAVVLLQPTSPLRTAKQVNDAMAVFTDKNPDSVVTVHEAVANNNPYWIIKKDETGNAVLFATSEPIKKVKNRRQELPVCYSRNDVAFVFKPENVYATEPSIYGEKVELLVMREDESADINTPLDWTLCELRMKLLGYSSGKKGSAK